MQSQTTNCPSNSNSRVQGMSTEAKFRLMQQQLCLLLHASQCRREGSKCTIEACAPIRNLLPHMETCSREKDCTTPYCSSSKQIIKHFRICQAEECKVCSAIKKPAPSGGAICTVGQNGPCPSFTGLKSDVVTLNGMKRPDSPEINHDNSYSTTSETNSQPMVNGEVTRNLHESRITDQQRELAMKKFVSDISLSIFPTANSTAFGDPRMRQFLDYVKRMEKDIFMRSNSTEEYYQAMTVKYRSIISELREKRRLRSSRPQRLNGEHTGGTSAGFCDSGLPENGSAKSNSTFEQDQFSDALEIVSKREDHAADKEESRDSVSSQPPISSKCDDKSTKSESVCCPEASCSYSSTPVDSTCKSEQETREVEESESEPSETKLNEVKPTEPESSEPTSQEPSRRRIWYANELLQHFLPVVNKISKEKDAEPFLQPVDWKSLEIYDYPQIVSVPMDLSTIRKKLEDKQYKDPWEVVDDFWLMFNNAWLYNKKTSKVYKTCTRLAEVFESVIDPVMRTLGFCCGHEYYYQPPTLTCLTPKFCAIYRDAIYYVYKSDGQTPGLLDQKYTVCERCFNEAGDEIALDSDSTTPVTVQKSLLEKCKNDVKEKEPFVFCKNCGRKWHKVCAIYMEEIWPDGFICNHCIVNYGLKRPENRFTARKLTTCKLSNFLEKRVNDFLKKKEADAGDVIIRVLAAADKSVEVKPGMKAKFCETGEMPESFPYRVKAIFAFQEIDGQEVCFFGLHVQEYGSECPHPNTRRVYVAYLDSVYFFRPKQYRTEIYHELLVGYIQYAKILGFTMAHIWACPPSEGDDYIFHMHPSDQKIPKPKRLQEWYQKMLKKALIERIVVDYKDICQDACESRLVSPTELAYFEGDFWPNTLEEIFKEMDEEDARRKREQEVMGRDDDDDDTKENVQTRESDENPGKKKAKRRKMKRSTSMTTTGKRKRLGLINSADMATEVARRVYDIMEKHKENFFVIRLHPQNQVASMPPIKDPDPLINSDLMECRGAFLEKAREKHLEFSSLRRAKFSTLAMLYELHNENRQPLMYSCNVCGVQLETPWHCKQCNEYDLCPRCYETENHPHPMFKVGLGLDDCNKGQDLDNEVLAQESGRDRLNRLVKALGHSCSCKDANCRVFVCKELKQNVLHFRVHTGSGRNQCPKCRTLSFLCYYHSKTCHELNCQVPLCPKLKAKMKQQQKQQRLKQTQMLRRRMATMQRCNSMTPNHQPTPTPPQPYQQFSQPNSTSDCVSSPMSTSMQSSPFSAATPATTTPFGLTSPLSRSQSSIHSPQASFPHPSNVPTSVPYQSPSQSVPQQMKPLTSNSSIPRSPSMGSVQSNSGSHCQSTSASPYGQSSQIYSQMEVDSMNPMQPDMTRPGAYSNPPQVRHPSNTNPVVQTSFNSAAPPPTRPNQLDRMLPNPSPSMGPAHCMAHSNMIQSYPNATGHSTLIHRSPTGVSSVPMNAPSSPKHPQCFPLQPGNNPLEMDASCVPQQQQQLMSSSQRLPNEIQQSGNYAYSKQQSMMQRHPSQLYPPNNEPHGGMVMSQNQFPPPSGNSVPMSWKQTGSGNAGTISPSNPYSSMQSSQLNNSANAANVGVSSMMQSSNVPSQRSIPTQPISVPNAGPSMTVSTLPPGISPDDIRMVQQAFNTIRQRGGSASEFSGWLNANPQFMRAWQYVQQQQQQQQHVYNQQVPAPASNSSIHPAGMVPYPQGSYQVYQGQQFQQSNAPPSRSMQPSRYSYSQVQQSPMSVSQNPHQLQQWSSVPNQQVRFRSSGPTPNVNQSQQQPQQQQQQFQSMPCYQQPVKLPGPQPSAMQVQNQPQQQQRFLNQPNSMPHPVQQMQQQSNQQVPINSTGSNLARGPGSGGMAPQMSQLSRCPDQSSNLPQMGPNRSAQPSPHYSSVMLSQLLGPGQTANPSSSSGVNSLPNPDYSIHSQKQQQQHMMRQDFIPPPPPQQQQQQSMLPQQPNMLPIHPHYQDGSL